MTVPPEHLKVVLLSEAPDAAAGVADSLNGFGCDVEQAKAEDVLGDSSGPVAGDADVLIIYAPVYEEKRTLALCRRTRDQEPWSGLPLLVAVNMYQMPLANRVKELPNASYIFRPIEKADFEERMEGLMANTG